MTRLAVLSDVHGNLPALEAIWADLRAQGTPDVLWVLGDLALFCPWPAETLARLQELPGAAFLQGNTDRYLVTGLRPAMAVRSEQDWQRMPLALTVRDTSFSWTVERLSYGDCEFLRNLPTRLEIDIPGSGLVVAVHAAPSNDEISLYPSLSDTEVAPHIAGLDARLMLYGHTHRPVDRTVGGVRLVNDGSVGLPFDGQPPSYVLLEFANGQCTVELRRVAYDLEAVIAELRRVSHPMQDWLALILRGGSPH